MILVDGKTPYEFACEWYKPESIAHSLASMRRDNDPCANIPDPTTTAFAEWLAGEYRLAMRKGIELGWNARKDLEQTKRDEVREWRNTTTSKNK